MIRAVVACAVALCGCDGARRPAGDPDVDAALVDARAPDAAPDAAADDGLSPQACAWTEAVDLGPMPDGGYDVPFEFGPRVHGDDAPDLFRAFDVVFRFVPPVDGPWDVTMEPLDRPDLRAPGYGVIEDCRPPIWERYWEQPRITADWRAGRPVYLQVFENPHVGPTGRWRLRLRPVPASSPCADAFGAGRPCGPDLGCAVDAEHPEGACQPDGVALEGARAWFGRRAARLRVQAQLDVPGDTPPSPAVSLWERDSRAPVVGWSASPCISGDAECRDTFADGHFAFDRVLDGVPAGHVPDAMRLRVGGAELQVPVAIAPVLAPGAPCDPVGVRDECPAGTTCVPAPDGFRCVAGAGPSCAAIEDGAFAAAGPDAWVFDADAARGVDRLRGCGPERRDLPEQIVRFTAPVAGHYAFGAEGAEAVDLRRGCARDAWDPAVAPVCRAYGDGVTLAAGESIWAVTETPPLAGRWRLTVRRYDWPVVASLAAVRGEASATVGVRAVLRGDEPPHAPVARLTFVDDSGRSWPAAEVLGPVPTILSPDEDGRGWHLDVSGRIDPRLEGVRFVRVRLEVREQRGDAVVTADAPIDAPAGLAPGSECDPSDAFTSCGPGAGCLGAPPRCVPFAARIDGGRADGLPAWRGAELRLSVSLPPDVPVDLVAFARDAAGRPLSEPVFASLSVPPTCAASQDVAIWTRLAVADWTAIRTVRLRLAGRGLPDVGPVDVPFAILPLAADGEPCGRFGTGLPACAAPYLCRPGGDGGACAAPVAPVIDEARATRDPADHVIRLGVLGEAPDQDVSTLAMEFLDADGASIGRLSDSVDALYGDGGRFEVRYQPPPEYVPPGVRAIRVAMDVSRLGESDAVVVPIGAPADADGACRGLPFDRCPAGQLCARGPADASPGVCVTARPQRVRDAWFVVRDTPPRLAVRVETENATSAPTFDVYCSGRSTDGDPLPHPIDDPCARPSLDVHPDAISEVREYAADVPPELASDLDRLARIDVQSGETTFHAQRRPADDLALGAPCDPREVVARCGPGMGCFDGTCVDPATCR